MFRSVVCTAQAHVAKAVLCCCCRPCLLHLGSSGMMCWRIFPPPSEQAAVMLLQIDLESIEFWFVSSPCDVPVPLAIKPCPVAAEGLYSSPVKPSLSLQRPAQHLFTSTHCRLILDSQPSCQSVSRLQLSQSLIHAPTQVPRQCLTQALDQSPQQHILPGVT